MLERTQLFDINGMNYNAIQTKIENILQNELKLSTNSTKLGKSLIRITYFDENLDHEKQKENRISILKEPERRVYIQINGHLADSQVEKLWHELEKYLHPFPKQRDTKETISKKDEIIENIIDSIEIKGYSIEKNDALNFLENFYSKYERLPVKQEIESIVKGYIIMKNEDYFINKTRTIIEKEPVAEEFVGKSKTGDPVFAGRRKCPSCGDLMSIHEVTDKNQIIMDYPRIYGRKKYCGRCGYEWH
ncbi:MAG: hypothetical protein ACFFE4_03965 [Candidatus Thorarchaeota archaeon]